MIKNIFVFDQNKCVGCSACSVACLNENAKESSIPWRNIYPGAGKQPDLPLFYLSMSCNHCEDAPCMKGCPALAYSRDDITGAVLHQADKCIGCAYCTWTCPFDAPKFSPEKGIVEKCTFCNHRIKEGLKPACAELCPVGALDFEQAEFSREASRKSSPVPVDVGSRLKIIPLQKKEGPVLDTALFFENGFEPAVAEVVVPKISAKKEWPLLIFTLLVTAMVSVYSAGLTRQFSMEQKLVFIAFGVLAAFFSTLHLGKKWRAWRAILNVRNSWLSREILFFGLFIGGVLVDLLLVDVPDLVVILFGIGLLISIDMLYRVATWGWTIKIHSAQVILIGLSLYFLLAGHLEAFAVIGLGRIFLYLYRKETPGRWRLGFTRVRPLILVTAIFTVFWEEGWVPVFIFALGEILDRIEFYNELNVSHPQTELNKKVRDDSCFP